MELKICLIFYFFKLSNQCPGDVGAADADNYMLGTVALEGRSAMALGIR